MLEVGSVLSSKFSGRVAVTGISEKGYVVIDEGFNTAVVTPAWFNKYKYVVLPSSVSRGQSVYISGNAYTVKKADANNYILADALGRCLSINKGYFNIKEGNNKRGLEGYLTLADRGEIPARVLDNLARGCKDILCREFEQSKATLKDLRVVAEGVLRGDYRYAYKTNLYVNLSVEYCRSLEIIRRLAEVGIRHTV